MRNRLAPVNQIHMFMAGPAGLAVMIGQLSNTLGPMQTYEYITQTGTGVYQPAALLRPSE